MKESFILVLIIIMTAGITFSADRFTDNDNETVTDNKTGLIWQKCSYGLSGKNCTTGTVTFLKWVTALAYCEGLSLGGRTDWRLPNINELRSIIDVGTYYPAINIIFFPYTYEYDYWSSTSLTSFSNDAWYINFYSGTVDGYSKTSQNFVRCVSGP